MTTVEMIEAKRLINLAGKQSRELHATFLKMQEVLRKSFTGRTLISDNKDAF